VVDLHLRAFGANSGRRFLERGIYPTMLNPTSTGFGFVQVRNGKVVGFIAGMLDTSAWQRTLWRTRGFECLMAAAHMCLRGWGTVVEALQTLRYLSVDSNSAVPGHLFTLAVDEAYQGRGLAVKLIEAFLDHGRSHGMSRCWTRTSKANLAAHRLYMHVGFRTLPELTKHGKNRVVYRLDFETPDGAEEEGVSKPMAARRQETS
jgi:ribosomal protein S18 acetylase RimI-like enzyme